MFTDQGYYIEEKNARCCKCNYFVFTTNSIRTSDRLVSSKALEKLFRFILSLGLCGFILAIHISGFGVPPGRSKSRLSNADLDDLLGIPDKSKLPNDLDDLLKIE